MAYGRERCCDVEVCFTSLSRGRSAEQSKKKAPDDTDLLTLIFSFLQLGFFMYHHSGDRHVRVLLSGFPDGLGQCLPGSRESNVSGTLGPFSVWQHRCTLINRTPSQTKMVLLLYLRKQVDLKWALCSF